MDHRLYLRHHRSSSCSTADHPSNMPREISTRPVICERGRFNRCGTQLTAQMPVRRLSGYLYLDLDFKRSMSMISGLAIIMNLPCQAVPMHLAEACSGRLLQRKIPSAGSASSVPPPGLVDRRGTLFLIIDYKNQLRDASHRHLGCELRSAAAEPTESQVTGRQAVFAAPAKWVFFARSPSVHGAKRSLSPEPRSGSLPKILQP
jgi:hypothetical protein